MSRTIPVGSRFLNPLGVRLPGEDHAHVWMQTPTNIIYCHECGKVMNGDRIAAEFAPASGEEEGR